MDNELIFETRNDFRNWLESKGKTNGGVWLILGKNSTFKTLSAHEALEEALCFGWIDSTIVSIDESRYRKYFAPRRKGSRWSEKNKKIVQKLIEDKKMTEDGLKAIERAKKSGEWDKERDRGVSESQQTEFEDLIQDHTAAYQNFMSASPSYKKQFTGYYYEAKSEEARKRRLEKIIGLLNQNKRLM